MKMKILIGSAVLTVLLVLTKSLFDYPDPALAPQPNGELLYVEPWENTKSVRHLDILPDTSLCKDIAIQIWYVYATPVTIYGMNDFQFSYLVPSAIDTIPDQEGIIMYNAPYNQCTAFTENYMGRLTDKISHDIKYILKVSPKHKKHKALRDEILTKINSVYANANIER